MSIFQHFKRFFKHTTIYATGSIISRIGAFLLIPLYTRYLTPDEYGTLEIFYVTSTVFQTFLGMMISHSALRFYFEYDREEDRKKVISTAFLSSLIFSLPVLLFLSMYSNSFSHILFKSPAYSIYFKFIFAIVALELSKEIALAFLRAKELASLFISLSVLQLLMQVGLGIYMVAYLKKGVEGILLGNLISTFAVWMVLTFITLRYCGINFHLAKLKAMFKYSYPFVFASLGGMVINSSDRFFLKAYSTLGTIGLYALGFRFGMIVRTLLIEPFNTSFGPFRFSIMRDHNAREIYSRSLTYFLFIIVFLSLGIALFSKEVLTVMTAPSFLDAYKVVPVILVSIILGGITYIFQTGILLMKKTKCVFYITTIAMGLVLLFNWFLIPKFNMYGAAMAQILCNFFVCFATYYISQKLYPVKYEFNRILKILLVSLSIYFFSLFVPQGDIIHSIFMKSALIISFPIILGLLKFYQREEIDKFLSLRSVIGLRICSI